MEGLAALFLVLCTSLVMAMDFSVKTGRDFGFIHNVMDGSVLAFGRNTYGQLGVDTSNDAEPVPTPVKLPEEVLDVSAGAFHSLFVTESGMAYSAGRNNFGQLGYGTSGSMSMPQKVEGLILDDPNVTTPHVTAVAAGYGHSVFLLSDGSVRAVGQNNQGQLGDGTTARRETVVEVNLQQQVTAIAAGYDFTYYLTESGDVFATGNNLGGQLGDGTRDSQTSPVKVASDVKAISAGESHGLFVTTTGELLATGANFDGQIGSGGDFAASPRQISTMEVSSAFAGGDSSAFIHSDADGDTDTLWGLGSNRDGQLGLGNMTMTSMATQIRATEPEGATFKMAALGSNHGLFLSLAGVIFSAGDNSYGQLGDGTYEQSSKLMEIFKAPTITNTETMSSTMTATQTGTTTEPGSSETTQTGATTETATATQTDTASRANQDTGPSRRDLIRLIVIVSILGIIFLAILLQCFCSSAARRRARPQGGALETADNGDIEAIRAGM